MHDEPLLEVDALTAEPVAPAGGEGTSVGGIGSVVLHVFAENRLAVVGAGIIGFMVLFCFLGPVVYSTNQSSTQDALLFSTQNAPPGSGHLLGTDTAGFDVLGRIMYGGKISLEVGFAAAAIATVIGVLFGAISGFFGGWVDALMMRIVDVLLSVPILFLVIVLAVIFHPSLTILILVIGLTAWLVPARLVRGETLSLRVREYVLAVRVMGGSNARIVLRHIIPNTIGTIIVNATFQVADAILLLAALGFIGLGVPAPKTDWGSMLADGVNSALNGYWWQIYPAGVAIVLVVVAFNFVGDALRDAFEVRLQRR
ncbi:MAG: peptide/nickel transport system permease protein [Gaiellales bacterium]|nr:peptide/nickel transport system permease protein [Gaiellales bacterium]